MAFGTASGLTINLNKCAVYPIRCDGINLQEVMEPFPCQVQHFPCQYLGLPLSIKALTKNEIMPLILKIVKKLPAWKGKFLNRAGRLNLVNMVLSSIPTYHMTVFALKKWAIKKIDKIRRNFFWKGAEEINSGHCLVRWKKVKRPKKQGELGVLDLEMFGRALTLRWADGCGMSGSTPQDHGQEPFYHATQWIGNCLEQAQLYRLEMAVKQNSGNHPGCKEEHQWTLHRTCTS